MQGQQPVMRQFTAEDGLPGGTIYVTIQDQQGYIWIGTDRGIIRFDGNTFKVFTIKDGLPSNEVWGISEDKLGRLWLDTFNGICYIKEGEVHILHDEVIPKEKEQINHILTSIGHYIELNNRNIFYLPEEGKPIKVSDKTTGNYYLPYGHIITELVLEDSLRKKVRAKYQLLSNQKLIFINETVVIDTDDSFGCKFEDLRNISKQEATYKRHVDVESISKNEAFFLINRQFWRLNKKGFYKDNMELLPKPKDKNLFIEGIKKLAPNLIWLKTNNGNFIVDSLLQINSNYDFLNSVPINNILIDKQNNLWLASHNRLIYISQKVLNSRSFTIDSKVQPNSFKFLTINDRKDIWCLSANGYLYNLDLKKGLIPFLNKPIMNAPTNLSFDFNNNLWVSGSGLAQISSQDLYNDHLNLGTYEPQSLRSYHCTKAVKNFHFPNREKIIIASFNCFAEFHIEPGKIISKLQGRYYGIAEVEQDHFVVSGNFGTQRIIRKNEILKKDTIPSDSDHPILHLPTNTIVSGADKTTWLAVNNIGVYRWNESQLDSIIELTNILVQSLYLDKNQQLWACTNEGLAKVYNIKSEPFSYDFQWFRTGDGLISNDVKAVLIEENKIIAATNKGITVIDEQANNNEDTNIPIRFTALKVNGQNQELKSEYQLSYKENSLIIKYECLDFKNLGNIVFEHKLVGVDKQWVNNTSFEKEYPSLSSGDYTFQLRRKPNKATKTPPKIISLSFSIKPPFWKTGWFFLIVLLLLSFLTFLIYRFQISKVRTRAKTTNELNKKFAELELNALQSQMNPHFVFNALNAIQDVIFKNDLRDANRYLVKFSRLMRLILESSKEKTILLEDEIRLLQLYIDLELLRFEDKFTSEIQVEEGFSPAMISIPSMLLQPFVENAINHGLIKSSNAGRLLLSFNKEGQTLHCKIEDNGIGIKKSKENKKNFVTGHISRGMQLVEERQRVWNIIGDTSVKIEIKDLFDQEQGTTGTRVDIYITLEQFGDDPNN